MKPFQKEKLKQKLVLKTADMLIERNNKPCKDFHLKIFQREDDPTRVDFVYFTPEKYEKTVEKLQNTAQIEQFYEILDNQGEEKPCDISKFIFKTLYSTLDKEELYILKQSRKGSIMKKKHNQGFEEYLIAFDKFLEAKHKQDKRIKKEKGKLDPKLSLKEKRERIKKFRPPCLKCRKKVGNIFINKNGNLKIKCGSSKNPCNLAFDVKKPTILNLKKEINTLLVSINNIKEDIIKSKLDFLFKLKTEDVVTENFNSLKEEYNNLNAKLISYQIQLEDQTNIQERDKQLEIENIKLQEMIKLYSDNIKEYSSSEDSEMLTAAIKTYIDEIIPIQLKSRDLKYRLMGVKNIKSNDKKWLINFEAETIISVEKGEVGKNRLIQKRNLFTDIEHIKQGK